jgi:hypothetical protein
LNFFGTVRTALTLVTFQQTFFALEVGVFSLIGHSTVDGVKFFLAVPALTFLAVFLFTKAIPLLAT